MLEARHTRRQISREIMLRVMLLLTMRISVQERDDMRKRTRQERLNQLRTGTRKSWVVLHRENPPVEAF